jgi:ribosome-associated protein
VISFGVVASRYAPRPYSEDQVLNEMPLREAAAGPLHPAAGATALPAGQSTGGDALALARSCLEDMKAEEMVEIDLAGKTSIADTMIIASGRSHRHVGAIAEEVMRALKSAGHGPPRVEGFPACDWVLIDAGDLIIHVFRPEVRGFYNLEKMWGADRPQEMPKGRGQDNQAERLAG